MEAIFARSLDVTYVGPSPALNAYFKSNGEEIRVISGAANGWCGSVSEGGFADQGRQPIFAEKRSLHLNSATLRMFHVGHG